MKVLNVYLAGRVKGLDDEGSTWRSDIKRQLEAIADWNEKRINVFDPTKFFSYSEKKHKTNKQIKEYYMYKLAKSDIVIVNVDDTTVSIGTAQEVQFAVDHGIPVLGWGTHDIYPWIGEVDCQVVFESMAELTDYVRDYYL